MSLFDDLPEPVAEDSILKRKSVNDVSDTEIPATKKSLIDLISLLVGEAAEKGERVEMQDCHLNILNFTDQIFNGAYSGEAQRISLFGVFDGHGGARAAEFAKQYLPKHLASKFPSGSLAQIERDIKLITLDAYKNTDEEFLKEAARSRPHLKDGSTATTVLLVNNTLYIANIGDSSAVIARCNEQESSDFPKSSLTALQVTRDHTPLDPGERERLSRLPGVRIVDGRINGQLEVSRSFGDYQYKRQGVSCLPDVKKYELVHERDRFMLIACDGLWKCFTPQKAVEKVSQLICANPLLKQFVTGKECQAESRELQRALNGVCLELVREAILHRLSGDNVTCLLLLFAQNSNVVTVATDDASKEDIKGSSRTVKPPAE
ncbi:hypothetical protein ACTXT7_004422 [Hymenolepis weldensis]